MQIIQAILLVSVLVYFWPWVLGIAALILCLVLTFPKSRSGRKKRRKTSRSLQGSTVAYIILKDGRGKFGITASRAGVKELDVAHRYSNEPIQILWTKTLPTRSEGYAFEAWCKRQVYVTKGREWFHVSEAPALAKVARLRWGS